MKKSKKRMAGILFLSALFTCFSITAETTQGMYVPKKEQWYRREEILEKELWYEEETVLKEMTEISEDLSKDFENQPEVSCDQPDTVSCLRVPQNIEIVLDPWEMDGKEQIYSDEYTIQNIGNDLGTLTLSFVCRLSQEGGVCIREEREELHAQNDKQIYIKMTVNGAEIPFSEEGAEYQAELKPGEELTLRFTGEVNENAEEPWRTGDVEVEGVYIWTTQEKALATPSDAEQVPGNIADEAGPGGDRNDKNKDREDLVPATPSDAERVPNGTSEETEPDGGGNNRKGIFAVQPANEEKAEDIARELSSSGSKNYKGYSADASSFDKEKMPDSVAEKTISGKDRKDKEDMTDVPSSEGETILDDTTGKMGRTF